MHISTASEKSAEKRKEPKKKANHCPYDFKAFKIMPHLHPAAGKPKPIARSNVSRKSNRHKERIKKAGERMIDLCLMIICIIVFLALDWEW